MSNDGLNAVITLTFPSGEVKEIPLERRTPISIGSHKNNDVQLKDAGLGTMHCRLNWTDKGVVIAAATSKGVSINGSPSRKAVLTLNDEVALGDVILRVAGDDAAVATGRAASGVDLKPVSQDDLFGDIDDDLDEEDQVETVKSKPKKEASAKKASIQESAVSAILDDDDFLDDEDMFDPSNSYRAPSADDDDEIDNFDDDEGEDVPSAEGESDDEEDVEDSKEAKRAQREARRNRNAVRPGEEELLRSKFLQILGIGSVTLVILAAIFYVLFLSNNSQQMYDAALDYHESGQYSQAIEAWKQFLETYPNAGDLSDDAQLKIGQARIEKEISGAAGIWDKGLDQLNNYIQDNRGTKGFATSQRANLFDFARRITEGAIDSAKTQKKREFLEIATEARKKVTAYAPESEAEAKEINQKLDAAYREAEKEVLKEEFLVEHLAKIDAALAENAPLVALEERRNLLTQYPVLSDEPELAKKLGEILAKEKSLIQSSEVNEDGVTTERESTLPPPLTIAVHTRSQTSGQSEGEVVLIQTQYACYGIDTITGQPVWERFTGPEKSFFPLLVDSAPEGVLFFDSLHHELVVVELKTGNLIWRQPLRTANDEPELVTGKPLVHESSIFVTTDHNNFYQLDLRSGRTMTRLTISQPLLGSPALTADEQHCIVPGEQEIFYYFSLRPLQCQAVSLFGHRPGNIDIPILSMGNLALITQNTGADKCTLKVLRTEYPDNPEEFPQQIEPIDSATIDGRVVNPPFLRGKQLVVHSTGRRLTSFTVSADTGTKTLTQDGTFQFQKMQSETQAAATDADSEEGSNVFLYIGPNGQLWMTQDALRKLQINSDHFQLNPKETAEGEPVQPLQMQHEQVFVGRSHPFSPAVFLSQANRQSLDSYWRTICGARVIGTTQSNEDTLVCLTDAGSVVQINRTDLENSRFLTKLLNPIPLDRDKSVADSPLRVMSMKNGYLFVSWGTTEPFYSMVTRMGQVLPPQKLSAPLETDPIEIEAGTVLPVADNLILLPSGANSRSITSPMESPGSTWKAVLPLAGNDFLGLNSDGYLARYEFTSADPAHFREVTPYELGVAVDVKPVLAGDKLYLASADGKLHVIDTNSLTINATIDLPAPAAADLWVVDNMLLVQAGNNLVGYSVEGDLEQAWSVPLDNGAITAKPLAQGGRLIATDLSGRVLAINQQDGVVTELTQIDVPVVLPLIQFGNETLAATIEGSLFRVTSLLSQ
ncbi:MAG: hypothetical protein CMJ46_04180 [Planctomyces sp.]|nr:hypothetical protein [Planctomyces sp.]